MNILQERFFKHVALMEEARTLTAKAQAAFDAGKTAEAKKLLKRADKCLEKARALVPK